MLAITAIAIKTMSPNNQERRLRESARLVNGAIAAARARAIESGRPYGVAIELDAAQAASGNFRFARAVHFVETPEPYSGDTINNSFAQILAPAAGQIAPTGAVRVGLNAGGTPGVDSGFRNLVRVGDLIQFGNQGHYYQILGPNAGQGFVGGDVWTIRPAGAGSGSISGVRNPGLGVRTPYRVYRQPVKAAAPSVELPEGMVVDLAMSGFGPAGTEFNAGVIILFTANGSVGLVIGPGGSIVPPLPMFLLIGEQRGVERLPPPNTAIKPDESYNLGDFRTFWIGVNHQTGLVTTVENVGGDNHDEGVPSYRVDLARGRAILMQTAGGR